MKKFWHIVLKPILELTQPRKIVKVCLNDHLIPQLLEYCKTTDTKLTRINPEPTHTQYDANLSLFWNNSVNALPQVTDYDMILLDNEPNWYTVFSELKIIENYIVKNNKDPIIILHNTSWPYARRDLYHHPEEIPTDYIHDYKTEGVFPGISGLVPLGLNYPHKHAVLAGGSRNGVLTAVEDFMRQTTLELTLLKLNCFNGLSILLSNQNEFKAEIDNLLATSPMQLSYKKEALVL